MMGLFNVTVGVGHPGGGDLSEVSAMVDTGAAHSVLPESLLTNIGIEPVEQRTFELADGNQVEYPMGIVRLCIDDRQWHCPVIFGPNDQYLVGATTLETFSFMVAPEGERLVPKIYRARPI